MPEIKSNAQKQHSSLQYIPLFQRTSPKPVTPLISTVLYFQVLLSAARSGWFWD